jgi:CSLREA domain-containing protein
MKRHITFWFVLCSLVAALVPAVSFAAPSSSCSPLKLFWHAGRGDYFTTATQAGEQDGLNAGYSFIRTEGCVFSGQLPGTVPLKLFWHPGRGDYFTGATQAGEQDALNAGYIFVRVEGYVFPSWRPHTVPLKLFWHAGRGDNVTTATADGEQAALNAGYIFVRVEGYVYAHFQVNSTVDQPDSNPGDGRCIAPSGVCTLRAAINEVNAGSVTNIISLPAGQYQLTGGELAIYRDMHLRGAGADQTIIDGNQASRVFDITGWADITGVMIQNGKAGPGFLGHTHGGGIHNHGHLTLRNSAISGNVANNTQPHGGGIYSAESADLANITISYNSANIGGGIYNANKGTILNNVTISGNLASSGGGIYTSSANFTYTYLTNSIVANNDGLSPGNNCDGGPVLHGGNNLQYALSAPNPASCGFYKAIVPVADPQLQPVLNSNGSAIYFALPQWSPAIDAGNPAVPNGLGIACGATDQRLVARAQDGNGDGSAVCDIGAYERRPSDP